MKTPETYLLISPGNRRTKNIGDFLLGDSIKKFLLLQNPPAAKIVHKLMLDEAEYELGENEYQKVFVVAPRITESVKKRFNYINSILNRDPQKWPPIHIIGANQGIPHFTEKLFSHPRQVSKKVKLNGNNIHFYSTLKKQGSLITCRDILAKDIFDANGIKETTVIGDPALFDTEYIGSEFVAPPQNKPKIAITTPHKSVYYQQCIDLMEILCVHFGSNNISLNLHSEPLKKHEFWIIKAAEKFGFDIHHAYRHNSSLDLNEEIDIHIGHRLHGHIAALRKRKPSILLCEDGRAIGHAETVDALSVNCMTKNQSVFSRIFKKPPIVNNNAASLAFSLLKKEYNTNFYRSKTILKTVDNLYTNCFYPLIIPTLL